MKKATTNVLVIEELTDLLYELNDIYNLQRDVNCENGEHLLHRTMKAIFYTGFCIELISLSTNTPRDMNEMVRGIIRWEDQEGYIDRGDLEYAIEKARLHISRMNLAYKEELGAPIPILFQIIQLCLTETNYLIYGTTGSIQSNTIPGDEQVVGNV